MYNVVLVTLSRLFISEAVCVPIAVEICNMGLEQTLGPISVHDPFDMGQLWMLL